MAKFLIGKSLVSKEYSIIRPDKSYCAARCIKMCFQCCPARDNRCERPAGIDGLAYFAYCSGNDPIFGGRNAEYSLAFAFGPFLIGVGDHALKLCDSIALPYRQAFQFAES